MEVYNKRIMKILAILRESEKTWSSNQFALSLGVTSRTIRSDLKELDAILQTKGASIIAEAGLGYRLQVHAPEEFCTFLDALGQVQDNVVPNDPDDRAMYIIHLLLMNTMECKTKRLDPFDLADMLFISMSTLKKDIKIDIESIKNFPLLIII